MKNIFKGLFRLQMSLAPDNRVLIAVSVVGAILTSNALVSIFGYASGSGSELLVWGALTVGCFFSYIPLVGFGLGCYQFLKITRKIGKDAAKNTLTMVCGDGFSGYIDLDLFWNN